MHDTTGSFNETFAPSILKGFVLKEGHKVRNWKRRYVVVEDGYLRYYERISDNHPYGKGFKGEICLKGYSVMVTADKRIRLVSTISKAGKDSTTKNLLLDIEVEETLKKNHDIIAWYHAILAHITYANNAQIIEINGNLEKGGQSRQSWSRLRYFILRPYGCIHYYENVSCIDPKGSFAINRLTRVIAESDTSFSIRNCCSDHSDELVTVKLVASSSLEKERWITGISKVIESFKQPNLSAKIEPDVNASLKPIDAPVHGPTEVDAVKEMTFYYFCFAGIIVIMGIISWLW